MIVFVCLVGFVETQTAGPDSLFIIQHSVRGFHYRNCLQRGITSWRGFSAAFLQISVTLCSRTRFQILSVFLYFLPAAAATKGKPDSKPLLDPFKHSCNFSACLLANVLQRVPLVSGADSSVIPVLVLMAAFKANHVLIVSFVPEVCRSN